MILKMGLLAFSFSSLFYIRSGRDALRLDPAISIFFAGEAGPDANIAESYFGMAHISSGTSSCRA